MRIVHLPKYYWITQCPKSTFFWQIMSIKVWKSMKNSSKNTFFVSFGPHCALGINLSTPLELASNFRSIHTLEQPFRPKLEVSIPNPPTEIQLCFSFWWSDSEKNDKVSFVKTSGLKLKDSLIQIFFKIWLYPNIYFGFYSHFIRLKFG